MRVLETRQERLRVVFAVAMVVAPFLALLYGREAALMALVAGLVATAFLAFDASRSATADPRIRRRMVAAAAINLGLALLAGLLLLVRLR